MEDENLAQPQNDEPKPIVYTAPAPAEQSSGTEAPEETAPRIVMTADVMHLAELLEAPPETLKARLDGKTPDGNDDPNAAGLTEGQIAGLLETERSGKNRTDIVKVLCDRLGIKSPYEVTSAGPAWTNPVNRDVLER